MDPSITQRINELSSEETLLDYSSNFRSKITRADERASWPP
jgi:hypothetical protein